VSSLFVTGSGTGIGKTYVCCRLIEALRADRQLRVVKPVASGVVSSQLADSDTAQLLTAQRKPIDITQFEQTTPWHFRAPISPDMAAIQEGRSVPFDEVVAFSRAGDPGTLTIVEGIGGAMVPLDEQHTVLDWMVALDTVVWLVVGTYLGAISHALSTLRAMEQRGLEIGAIVLNESNTPQAGSKEIAAQLRRFTGAIPIIEFGRPPTPAQIAKLVERVPA
jgi:dethiobiotin synthetase